MELDNALVHDIIAAQGSAYNFLYEQYKAIQAEYKAIQAEYKALQKNGVEGSVPEETYMDMVKAYKKVTTIATSAQERINYLEALLRQAKVDFEYD